MDITVGHGGGSLNYQKVPGIHSQQGVVPSARCQHNALPPIGDKRLERRSRHWRIAGGGHYDHKAAHPPWHKGLAAQAVAFHLQNLQRKAARLRTKQRELRPPAKGPQLQVIHQIKTFRAACVDSAARA
jgi:hypothetical protein